MARSKKVKDKVVKENKVNDTNEFLYCNNHFCPREECIYHVNKTERNVLYYWTNYCKRGEEDKCKYYKDCKDVM